MMADYILAGITDIANALCKPAPNSPLESLTNSQVLALEQLMIVLHGKTKGTWNTAPDIAPTTTGPTLRVGPPADIQIPATTLRVAANPPPQVATLPSDWQHPTNEAQIKPSALIPPATLESSNGQDNPTVVTSNHTTQPRHVAPTQQQT